MAVSTHPSRTLNARPTRPRPGAGNDPAIHLTLLELVRTIGEITDDETEIVATVVHMLRSGKVKLAGTFRDEPLASLVD